MQLNAPREHRRDRLRALDADLVLPDVEVGQGGAEQIKPNRNAEKRGMVVQLAGDKCSIRKRVTSCILPGKRSRDGLRALNADLVEVQIQAFQRGTEKPNRERESAS